jgi:hypothetical protein
MRKDGSWIVPSGNIPPLEAYTPFDSLVRGAVPNGSRRAILARLNNQVTWGAVCHWRKGRRKPPAWVIERFQPGPVEASRGWIGAEYLAAWKARKAREEDAKKEAAELNRLLNPTAKVDQ